MSDKPKKEEPLERLTNYSISPGIPTRAASESSHVIPSRSDAQEATRLMRRDIEAFSDKLLDFGLEEMRDMNFEEVLATYNSEVEGIMLLRELPVQRAEDFMLLDITESSAETIKKIVDAYEEGSIPRILLDMVLVDNEYTKDTVQQSAKRVVKYISNKFSQIRERMNQLKESSEISESDSIKKALSEELNSYKVIVQQAAILSLGKIVFEQETFEADDISPYGELVISSSDVQGVVAVYRLQRRPYTHEELLVAHAVLEKDPDLIRAMMIMQMLFTRYARAKLDEKPERSQYTLEHLNSMFISYVDPMSNYIHVAPNPGFLSTMINNWLGAIIRQGQSEGIDVLQNGLDEEIIAKGVISAERELSMFKMHVGRFESLPDKTKQVKWDGLMLRVCPANKMITEAGSILLAGIYKTLKENQTGLK